jgi:hypothetical protein
MFCAAAAKENCSRTNFVRRQEQAAQSDLILQFRQQSLDFLALSLCLGKLRGPFCQVKVYSRAARAHSAQAAAPPNQRPNHVLVYLVDATFYGLLVTRWSSLRPDSSPHSLPAVYLRENPKSMGGFAALDVCRTVRDNCSLRKK